MNLQPLPRRQATDRKTLLHDLAAESIDAAQHGAEPANVQEPDRRFLAGRAQQDVIGLMTAQHVVEESVLLVPQAHPTVGTPVTFGGCSS